MPGTPSEFPSFDTRAAYRPARAWWWGLVQGGIAIKLTDQGEGAAALTAKACGLAGAVAHVAHENEVMLREPAHQACQQQPGQVRRRLMPRAVHTIPLWGTVQGDQDGKGPWSCRE